jgi:choline dehydrogenase-like flavoprotein
MFLDSSDIQQNQTLEGDITIIGAGAAGIALAREFTNSKAKVLLLESGDLEFDKPTQDLYIGDVVGHDFPLLAASRLRYFGGTTNHWSGFSRPLDPLDFEKRWYVPYSGWPFPRSHLDPFYARAQSICQLGPLDYSETSWTQEGNVPLRLRRNVIDATQIFQSPSRLLFAEIYGDELKNAGNVLVIFNSNVTDIDVNEDARAVTRLNIVSLAGKRYWVKSSAYVLATGGIENARILLNADSKQATGLGNAHGNVGRFFMDHPIIEESGRLQFNRDAPPLYFYRHRQMNDIVATGFFALAAEQQRKEELLNCGILIDPIRLTEQYPSLSSAKVIVEGIAERELPDDLDEHLKKVLMNFDDVLRGAYRSVVNPQVLFFRTGFWSECPPDPESRVFLTAERDALGQRRVALDWRLPAEDFKRTYVRMHELLAMELGRNTLGRVRVFNAEPEDDPREAAESSYHHMGTTRMHPTPKEGVVDADCRVHGLANLFASGSSVFPTYGHANPTLTIVALALRLADHLKWKMT